MTLRVYDPHIDDGYGKTVYDMKEANAVRGGGNAIRIYDTGMCEGFSISLENDSFTVDITHTTANNLLRSILQSSNAEYFLYWLIKRNLNKVRYKNLWKNLGQEETTLKKF